VEKRSLVVNGMTCDHCASAVRAVPGDARLREAIEEAGYELAG
jgi:copper chaperone CopZ